MKNLVTDVYQTTHANPGINLALIGLGFLPALFNLVHVQAYLQIAYFCLLIPPAAFHCWKWFKTVILKQD